MTPLPPLSLYIHLPWCLRKCPYCDFNSHSAGSAPPLARYVDALIADARAEAPRVRGRRITSVFLGGGTPSLFPGVQIARLMSAVGEVFDVAADAEVTMEVNPGAVERDQLAAYAAAGVNRLSVGAQSFAPEMLRILGRVHGSDEIGQCVAAAREAGISNLNLDLMYGLPGQDVTAALNDLAQAIALDPEHLSWYELTLEPNTVFHAKPPADLPDEDLAMAIRESGQALLARHGYAQYEVSAYARDGRRCRHNLNYWRFGDYLAVGAGAHAKLTVSGDVLRSVRPANPLGYMEHIERGEPVPFTAVAPRDRLFEYMLNALRLNESFDEAAVLASTGVDRPELEIRLRELRDRGLLEVATAGHWRASALGRRFLNDLQAAFLP